MIRRIKNFYHLLEAILAAIYYGFPAKRLIVIGVTGTDGKTTTTNLIYHILTENGYKTAVLSTLSSLHTTTPDSWKLQKFLAQCVKNKCSHVVLEVSSHAIDQHRIWGINFWVGVLTNIANNEHLDYHKTFEIYSNTKLNFLKTCKKQVRWEEYKNFKFQTELVGEFNRQNCLSAIGAAKALGLEDKDIRKALISFKAPSGRFEVVNKKPLVIVDFAHTAQAFEKMLPEAKKLGKKLIHVFGCTGNRDKSKRPIMGAVAQKYDDVIILTHEDTYSEDPQKIINDIENGMTRHSGLSRISSRRDAIKKALELAKPNDVVIITGVGHQKTLNIGGKEIPWSDQKTVLELLHEK